MTMNFAGYSYFELNYKLLSFVGLGVRATNKKLQTNIARCVFIITGLTCFGLQVASIFAKEYSLELLLDVMPILLMHFVVFVRYIYQLVNTNMERVNMNCVMHDWNSLHHEDELKILRNYMDSAVLFRTFIIAGIWPYVTVSALFPFVTMILDAVAPLDHRRQRFIGFKLDLLVEQDIWAFPIAVALAMIQIVGGTCLMTIESLVISRVVHLCGMYAIISHRFDILMESDSSNLVTTIDSYTIYKRISEIVTVHQRVIRFADLIVSQQSPIYLIVIVMGIMATSMNLFRLCVAMDTLKTSEMLTIICALSCQLTYILVGTYIGQQTIDHGSNIFLAIYNVPWYIAPKPIQKLLRLIMLRCSQSTEIIVGGLFGLSLELFTMVVKSCVSYFMVMYSLQY